jgi:hypothetical protein
MNPHGADGLRETYDLLRRARWVYLRTPPGRRRLIEDWMDHLTDELMTGEVKSAKTG